MFRVLITLLCCLFPLTSLAECKVYTVKKDDTYTDISKFYFKDSFNKFYLEKYNKGAKLIPGKKIALFIPEHAYESYELCRNMINARLTKKKMHDKLEDFAEGIPLGLATVISIAGPDSIGPMVAVNLCAFALAIAEVTTNYGKSPNPPGTVSVFSIPKDVPQKLIDEFKLAKSLKEYDLTAETGMKATSFSMFIFVVHFTDLWSESRSIFKVLIKYFKQEKALTLSALEVFKTYLELFESAQTRCEVKEETPGGEDE